MSANDTYEMTGGTGSLRYLSPENFLGKPYNEKSDVYSFSIIMWELLARKPLLFMRSKRVGHARVECTTRCFVACAAVAHARFYFRRRYAKAVGDRRSARECAGGAYAAVACRALHADDAVLGCGPSIPPKRERNR